MTSSIPLSSRIYERLLVLYPEDLRRDYGPEMALVFAEDLEAARRQAGLRGAIRVWRCAIGEFLRFALPGYASKSALRVPLISLAFAVVSLGTEFLLQGATRQPSRFMIVGSLGSFGPMFVPLAVIWACRSRGVIHLNLSGRIPGETER